jgi:hypothetical protein
VLILDHVYVSCDSAESKQGSETSSNTKDPSVCSILFAIFEQYIKKIVVVTVISGEQSFPSENVDDFFWRLFREEEAGEETSGEGNWDDEDMADDFPSTSLSLRDFPVRGCKQRSRMAKAGAEPTVLTVVRVVPLDRHFSDEMASKFVSNSAHLFSAVDTPVNSPKREFLVSTLSSGHLGLMRALSCVQTELLQSAYSAVPEGALVDPKGKPNRCMKQVALQLHHFTHRFLLIENKERLRYSVPEILCCIYICLAVALFILCYRPH